MHESTKTTINFIPSIYDAQEINESVSIYHCWLGNGFHRSRFLVFSCSEYLKMSEKILALLIHLPNFVKKNQFNQRFEIQERRKWDWKITLFFKVHHFQVEDFERSVTFASKLTKITIKEAWKINALKCLNWISIIQFFWALMA